MGKEEQVLMEHISGYHAYDLGTLRLIKASTSLCAMTGFSEAELLAEGGYSRLVHPGDRAAYTAFLREMASGASYGTTHYRIQTARGQVLQLCDSMSVQLCPDGRRTGHSVLGDISEVEDPDGNLRFLSETIPCGFLKYSCDKPPKLHYVNGQMLRMLRFSGDLSDREEELYGMDILGMIPMEDRRRFSTYLKQVYRHGGPIAGEMNVLRFDGTRAHVFGWVTRCTNDEGEEEFQSACMDITQRHQLVRERETGRYLKALSEVYDLIFEYDLAARTVICLYAGDSSRFSAFRNIPMQMEEATEQWIKSTVSEEDCQGVRDFFQAFYRNEPRPDEQPRSISYQARSGDGILRRYTGLFVERDSNISLFCCRRVPEYEEAETLKSEYSSLKGMTEGMQRIVLSFTDGLAAFEVVGDSVTPLYASDNVCRFFGVSREEWLEGMKKRTPIPEFVSRSSADPALFRRLLEEGEAEFPYFDLATNRERRIRAICSRRTPGAEPRYVMMYNVEEALAPKVRIRTFGYFDVFVEENPIAFKNEKAEELFALLVDRRGGFVSPEEAISILWEDEPVTPLTLARYRKVAMRLKNTLTSYGAGDVMESVNGKRRLIPERVHCDLYEYLAGNPETQRAFRGSYLSDYSWGEVTLGELTQGQGSGT